MIFENNPITTVKGSNIKINILVTSENVWDNFSLSIESSSEIRGKSGTDIADGINNRLLERVLAILKNPTASNPMLIAKRVLAYKLAIEITITAKKDGIE